MAAMLVAVQGTDKIQVYREPCEVVEEWIQIHQNDGTGVRMITKGSPDVSFSD